MLRTKSGTPNYKFAVNPSVYTLSIVNQEDKVIGQADYDKIHNSGLLHRFVLVYVFDGRGRFFLQKRAATKPHGCMFAESVCAHVRYGEDYIQTAKRRLNEELGLHDSDLRYWSEVTKIHVYDEDKNWKNNAFVKIYECTTSRAPSVNKSEIKEGSFLPLEDVKDLFRKKPQAFVPGFRSTFEAYLRSRRDKENV